MLIINRHDNVLCTVCGTHEMFSHEDGCTWYAKNKDIAKAYIQVVEKSPFGNKPF